MEPSTMIGLMLALLVLIWFMAQVTEDVPVLIKKKHYDILMELRYLEHEELVDVLTNSHGGLKREKKIKLMADLPKEYHKYIDTQNYVNGVKVVRIQFEVY